MCGLSTVVTPAGASLTMYREIRSYANSIWDDNNNNNNSGVVIPPSSPFNTQSVRVPTTPAHLFFLRKKIPASQKARVGTSTVSLAWGANREVKERVKGKASRVQSVCVFFPSILDIKFVGRTSRGHTGGRSHRIFNPPPFCGACLDFCREKDSAIPFPRRP